MQARKRKTRKLNIPMCFAWVLLCLTLFSVHATSNLYARYTVSSEQQAQARVITFGQLTLEETAEWEADGTLRIIPGVDIKKKATVSFSGSEAATYVFMKIDVAANGEMAWVRDGKQFSLKSGSQEWMRWNVADWTYLKEDGSGSYIYYQELAPNTKLDKKDVVAEDGKIQVSASITKEVMKKMTGIAIAFQAFAVQSNGFETPQDAWNSLSGK